MKFVDEAVITVAAGHGGSGSLSFRREKFLPKGGPDGGNGGKGGDVVLIAHTHLNTLAHFRYSRIFRGEPGHAGSSNNRTGAAGADCEVGVPVGTLVYDANSMEFITDMVGSGDRFVVAYGGKGGSGNSRFKSSTNRAPDKITEGKTGDGRRLRFELRVLADIGLLGLPNAGKSTLLAAVSAAQPKIGSYPFTTLNPQLGIVEQGLERFVMADIPGLIDGAAQGAGLGTKFLKHLSRTRLLLQLVDISSNSVGDAIEAVHTIETEITTFSETLASQPRWIVFNKIDLVDNYHIEELVSAFAKQYPWNGPLFAISGNSGKGCSELINAIFDWMKTNEEIESNA
ncbi:MAG: GTPase ObgE [Acidiferrobacteraceae bacterium]|nr:GTPase ObgE [Acidiferrobacteraceae bacterium]|tara:strand:- start:807 stop:1832 length:1026 start_codon:yes stop_codon:yes gene_type:complete